MAVTTLTENYLRVASLSIALYDYLLTLPAEYAFYRAQKSMWRPSLACILFILIRYQSVLVMTVSNVGYFSTSFDKHSCHRFFLVPAVLKVMQTLISHVVIAVRTFNISARTRWVGWFLAGFLFVVAVLEVFTNLYRRSPSNVNGNCVPINQSHHVTIAAWMFNCVAMLYDITTLGISSYYLLLCAPRMSRMSNLIKLLFVDGIVYFVALTGVNLFNLLLYRFAPPSLESAGVSLYYAITWIMTQRILLRLRKASHKLGVDESLIITKHLDTSLAITQALRSQFEHKGPIDKEFGDRVHLHSAFRSGAGTGTGTISHLSPGGVEDGEGLGRRSAHRDSDATRDAQGEDEQMEMDFDVQVRIEQNVTVEYDSAAYDRETYRRPRTVQWSDGPGRV